MASLRCPVQNPRILNTFMPAYLACSVHGYHSPILVQCEEFIRKCCRENGGYVRSVFGGSATLENTYLALDALTAIERIRENPDSRNAGNPLQCCD